MYAFYHLAPQKLVDICKSQYHPPLLHKVQTPDQKPRYSVPSLLQTYIYIYIYIFFVTKSQRHLHLSTPRISSSKVSFCSSTRVVEIWVAVFLPLFQTLKLCFCKWCWVYRGRWWWSGRASLPSSRKWRRRLRVKSLEVRMWSGWGDGDDWDLRAVVRGCCSPPPAAAKIGGEADPWAILSPFLLGEDDGEEQSLGFPDLVATETAMLELEELCKPFFQKPEMEREVPAAVAVPPPASPQRPTQSQIARSKRRKNQLKRVVRQVPADGLTSDVWAWRKYGQKPIKGSPYPRGYYRCSSSKGCPARKQVERSRTDPSMFIVTFTSDHNHPAPTHRNSLAGSTRQKHTPPTAAAAIPPELSPATPTTNTSAEGEGSSGQPVKLDEEVDQVDENMFMELAELHTQPAAGMSNNWFADVFPAPGLAAASS